MFEDLSYIDARDFLAVLDIKNISESSGEISFSCPSEDHFHGDRSPSARMNSRTTAWICHGCSRRGNAVTFLAWYKSLPETVARRLLEERYGGGITNAGIGNLEKMIDKIMNPEIMEEEKRIPLDEYWLGEFRVQWNYPVLNFYKDNQFRYVNYMLDRGFNPRTLEQWEIGYDKISDRITIPIRDHKGKLVGFKGRAWRDNTIPKYMILGDNRNQNRYGFQPYQKSHYVFGLDRFPKIRVKGSLDLIIVEGELNVIAMNQHGFKSVGIAGSEFSQIQSNLIVSCCDSSTIFLDNDKAGNKGTKKAIEMLSPYMQIKVVQSASGDAAELDTKTVQELISSARPALELQVEGKL